MFNEIQNSLSDTGCTQTEIPTQGHYHTRITPASPTNMWGLANACMQHIHSAHTEALINNKKLIVAIGEDHKLAAHAALRLALLNQLALRRDTNPDAPWMRFNTLHEYAHTRMDTLSKPANISQKNADLRLALHCLGTLQNSTDLCTVQATATLTEITLDIPVHFIDATFKKTWRGQEYITTTDMGTPEYIAARRLNFTPHNFPKGRIPRASSEGFMLRNAVMTDLCNKAMTDDNVSLGIIFTGAAHLGGLSAAPSHPADNSLSALLTQQPHYADTYDLLCITPDLSYAEDLYNDPSAYAEQLYNRGHNLLIVDEISLLSPKTYSEDVHALSTLTDTFPAGSIKPAIDPRLARSTRFNKAAYRDIKGLLNSNAPYAHKKHIILDTLTRAPSS